MLNPFRVSQTDGFFPTSHPQQNPFHCPKEFAFDEFGRDLHQPEFRARSRGVILGPVPAALYPYPLLAPDGNERQRRAFLSRKRPPALARRPQSPANRYVLDSPARLTIPQRLHDFRPVPAALQHFRDTLYAGPDALPADQLEPLPQALSALPVVPASLWPLA